MGRLSDKVVLVTGGGSGVGLAVAKQLLAEGAKVAIVGRDRDKLARAAGSLAGGERLQMYAADVGDAESIQKLVSEVTAQFGPINILVNNAGTNVKERTMRELSPETWQPVITTNLNGAFNCIHAVLPGMLERKDGVIINVVSVSGKRASPLAGAAYAASKFGMAALGTCLGVEERESGIRVSNIFPGEIDTPILDSRPTPVTAEQRKVILQSDDVAAAVLYVAGLPPHVNVPELVIKPTVHPYV